ncbi:MAG: electron transfer flavoprotein-ubiquinone oxidoreductase [Planctomycetes bacterium]|nr:electron transfer flavoprotein-ubiquinone oxidoreductase [Planctomycetota bacterium]
MQRETLEVDVLLVGAGAATLSCAIRLKQLLQARGKDDVSMLVIEKGEEVGHHQLSGAVLDPRALDELLPSWRQEGFPIDGTVTSDELRLLTKRSSFAAPGFAVPKGLQNHGKPIVSLQKMVAWLGKRAESLGIDVYAGFPGAEILWDGDRVTGVRMVDMGLDKHGQKKSTYQPGMDIQAKITVFGEGSRGSLTKQLVQRLQLAGENPQVYETGCKEVWKVKRGIPGRVIHTLGFPLPGDTYGGGWVYGLDEDRVSIGLVVGLDSGNPTTNPHDLFQRWKTHPLLREILDGGEMLRYGAKTIPSGGYWSMPRFYGDGFAIVGDSAGFVNMMRLKGIHLAMKSGMLAAEAIAEALATDDVSAATLSRYRTAFESSWAKEELWRARNFRQGFTSGRTLGLLRAGLQMAFGGRLLKDRLPIHEDHEAYAHAAHASALPKMKYDDVLTFDRLKDVYHSGTVHEEDQPCHLVVIEPDVCLTRCKEEYGNPCQHFCPAQVYEWRGDHLEINASNCVHCKTCDVADPYQIINWVTPEGGGGPKYLEL